jgi:hypothetical protein
VSVANVCDNTRDWVLFLTAPVAAVLMPISLVNLVEVGRKVSLISQRERAVAGTNTLREIEENE